jgi:hypothetical protein
MSALMRARLEQVGVWFRFLSPLALTVLIAYAQAIRSDIKSLNDSLAETRERVAVLWDAHERSR